MSNKVISFFIVISFAATASGDDYRSEVNEGYEYYKNGEYDKATENYRQAGIMKPDKALPNFGKGAALFRSNDFEGAGKEYSIAIDKGDDKIKADAYYNIGNTSYKSERYEDAIKSYINALKINPGDEDYKHNLEMALLKQQSQQQQQDQDESQNQKEQKQQDKREKDQKEQDQKQDQKQADSEKKEQQQQRQSADEQQMSEDDAKNLLSRFEEDEKEIQKRLKQVNIGRSSGHDW